MLKNQVISGLEFWHAALFKVVHKCCQDPHIGRVAVNEFLDTQESFRRRGVFQEVESKRRLVGVKGRIVDSRLAKG